MDHVISAAVKIISNDYQLIINLQLSSDQTMYDLKKSVHEKICATPDRQIAIYEGRIISDETNIGKLLNKGFGSSVFVVYIFVNTSVTVKERIAERYVFDDISVISATKWMQTESASLSEAQTCKIRATLKSLTEEAKSEIPVPTQGPLPAQAPAPAPPMPRWVDVRLISRMAVALFIFGQGLPTPLLAVLCAAFFLYYLFDTGVVSYLLHAVRPTPLPQLPWIRAWALHSQLFTRVPSAAGVLLDGFSIVLSLGLSLFPGWSPDGVMQL